MQRTARISTPIKLALIVLGTVALLALTFLGASRLFANYHAAAYQKCNGLNELALSHTGAIPATYELIDKHYTCRAFTGNTPQRTTKIVYTYGGAANLQQTTQQLTNTLMSELTKNGWEKPGIKTIDGHTTALRFHNEPLVGLDFQVLNAQHNVFQLTFFARDQWKPATKNSSKPQDVVASAATVRQYADHTAYTPTFVPQGYDRWQENLNPNITYTATIYILEGGRGNGAVPTIQEVAYSEDAANEYCINNCHEIGKNKESKPIYLAGNGEAYTQLGNALVTLSSFDTQSPPITTNDAINILNSLQAQQ